MSGSFKSSLFSRCFGGFASCKFPRFFQIVVNKSYVSLMGVDLKEFKASSCYESLNALFTRELLIKREIGKKDNEIISPCDSYISEMGKIEGVKALQIKGFEYSVYELLGENIQNKEQIKNGDFINFYLSPKDYHRYHVPCDMKVLKAVHIPGKLYPVNLKWLRKVPKLFIENERVVLECRDNEGKIFYMVFVGALNVGKMKFVFDDRIQTNVKESVQTIYEYDDMILRKGDELGRFEMGSTIVMLFEKESVIFTCKANQVVKFGDVIARKVERKRV